jgi:hypothetical protein
METPMDATASTQGVRKNWFERNWKWFVPTGCLTIAVLFLAFIAAVFGIVEASFKSSSVYTQALAQAQADTHVSGEIGRPLKPG